MAHWFKLTLFRSSSNVKVIHQSSWSLDKNNVAKVAGVTSSEVHRQLEPMHISTVQWAGDCNQMESNLAVCSPGDLVDVSNCGLGKGQKQHCSKQQNPVHTQ